MLTPFMPMQTHKHRYKIKIWQTDNKSNFYEEELKVKNEMGQMIVPQDSQVPIKTGASEPVKKQEVTEKANGYFYNYNGTYEGRVIYYKNKTKLATDIIATQVAGYSIFWKETK